MSVSLFEYSLPVVSSLSGTADVTIELNFSLAAVGVLTHVVPEVNNFVNSETLNTEVWALDINKDVVSKGDAYDDEVINLSIENILSTIRGERIFSPYFGSVLPLTTFEQINVFDAENLLASLLESIKNWETRITIIESEIQMNINTDENSLVLIIPYEINRNGLTATFSRKIYL